MRIHKIILKLLLRSDMVNVIRFVKPLSSNLINTVYPLGIKILGQISLNESVEVLFSR